MFTRMFLSTFKPHPTVYKCSYGTFNAYFRSSLQHARVFRFHHQHGPENVSSASVSSSLSRREQGLEVPCESKTIDYPFHHKRTFHTSSLKETLDNSSDESQLRKRRVPDVKSNSKDTSSLLETWFYEVSPYGSLNVCMPFKTVIKPLNPQDYPDMNKCIIELSYDNDDSSDRKAPNSHQLSQISDLYKLDVSFDKDRANMNVTCEVIEGVSVPVCCYLQVPLKSDLTVKLTGNESVTIESVESDRINVEADKGDINFKKVKSGSVAANSRSGHIISKSTLLGNVDLNCGGSGTISADKLQGSSVTCSTEMGLVDVKSLYTEVATFKTVVGDIHLGQCHGQICVVGERSNLNIGSLDGDLDAGLHQGTVNVLLSRHNKVDIDLNTGDIGLSFPEGVKTDLKLSCPTVIVADNLPVEFEDTDTPHYREGSIGEKGAAHVNARTLSGTIRLSVLDWIQTTKLAFMNGGEHK